MNVLAVAAAVALIVVAALARLAESAIGRIGRARAYQLEQERRRGASRLVAIAQDPPPHINVLLLVALACELGAALAVAALALQVVGSPGWWVALGASLVVVYVVCEVVPRMISLQYPERVALAAAPVVVLLRRTLGPLARLLIAAANALMAPLPGKGLRQGPFVTEEDIRHLVDVAEEDEEIEEEERELIHSVFEFGDTVVREVMVPRTDMVVIPAEATLEEALETITRAGYSRIPVYEGDTDNIVGVLYAKDLLKRTGEERTTVRARDVARPPLFVPEQKKVADLLREMQDARVHMAIVVDEYGGTAGLVTIEDLVEEIVGEIVDEYDQEEPLVEPLDHDRLRVDAKMPIDEVNELFDVDLPHEEWDTVGGLVFGLTGRVPVPGERVRLNGLEFETERVTGRRIQKVIIRRVAADEVAAERAE